MSIEPISFPTAKLVPKAWGEELWVINLPRYCLKRLTFRAGHSFSLHWHDAKIETWWADVGQLHLEYRDQSNGERLTKTLGPGDIIHVPRGNPHRLTALTDAVVWEVSTHHEDADSYRIEGGASQGVKLPASYLTDDWSGLAKRACPTAKRTIVGDAPGYGPYGGDWSKPPYPEDIGRRVKVAKGAHDPRGHWHVGEPEGVITRVGPVTCAWAIWIRCDDGTQVCANPRDCTFID